MTDLDNRNTLLSDWLEAKLALENARQEIDNQMKAFFEGKGEAIQQKQLDAMDDLIYKEAAARGSLDEFYSTFAR